MFKHRSTTSLILMSVLMASINAVELILRPARPTCTILISSFDPIKVQAFFPTIHNKQPNQNFKITLINDKTQTLTHQTYSEDNKTFRNNYYLDSNIVYSLCFQLMTKRINIKPVLIGFRSEQHFQNMLDHVVIPKQLINETNLKIIYETSKVLQQEVKVTIGHQVKQRQLQDKLVNLSLHKTERIITITTIECGIILISAIYQIFALRRFLIQKNMY